MRKKLRHLVLNWLDKKGIELNKKEHIKYWGKNIYVSKGAFSRQNHSDDECLFALSRHSKRILDIGCNVGQSTLLLILNTSNKVVCIDPNPKALSKCAENLIFNNLIHQAQLVNAFVGDADDKEILFYASLTDATGSMYPSMAPTSSSIGKNKLVNQLTAETICKSLDFKPDLIKIDVEGAERFVLYGMKQQVLENTPFIFVEMHSSKDLSITDNTAAILKWCQENKYTPYYLKTHSILESIEVIKSRGRYHLLLVHQKVKYPEYLRNISII